MTELAASAPPRAPGRGHGKILPHQQRILVNELALGLTPRIELARQFGVVRSAITEFAKRHQREIDEKRAALGAQVVDQLAGLWIANQEYRIAVYQRIAETAIDEKSVIAALKAVAEELGQLPPRASVVVMPVTHIIESVDLDLLK